MIEKTAISLLLFLAHGCSRPEGDALVIATPWPPADRAVVSELYREAHPSAPPIAWIPLMPDDDPSRLDVDLLLGIAAPRLDALAASGRLDPIAEGESRPWRAVHRPRSDTPPLAPVADPRRDPRALSRARARLLATGWPGGYADVVLASAHGWGPFAGPVEGVGLVRGARREADARAFLPSLHQAKTGGLPPSDSTAIAADGLLADLLGATLIDARDELLVADDTLGRAGYPEPYARYLGEAPPWPPTSVAKLRERPEADELLVALAREIAPDHGARAWLLRSWDGPKRLIDGAWFREVATAADGRLAREPRFRAWLRAEWTAWARQHYRRIAREAGKIPS